MSKTEQEARIAQVQSGLSAFQKGGQAPSCKSLLLLGWLHMTQCLPSDADDEPTAGQESSGEEESSESEEE